MLFYTLFLKFSDNVQNVRKYSDISAFIARISDSQNSNKTHREINNSTLDELGKEKKDKEKQEEKRIAIES